VVCSRCRLWDVLINMAGLEVLRLLSKFDLWRRYCNGINQHPPWVIPRQLWAP